MWRNARCTHYQRAKAPLLEFYISLHQALIRLLMGDALAARKHSVLAAQSLAALPSTVRTTFACRRFLRRASNTKADARSRWRGS